jgi:hypothetical protein
VIDQDTRGKQRVSHFDMFGGMDADARPFLLKPEQWRSLFNVRTYLGLSQVPVKKNVVTISGAPVEVLANLPCGDTDYGIWVALTKQELMQVKLSGATEITSYLTSTSRWSSHKHNDVLFYTRPSDRVRYTNGAAAKELFDHRVCWSKPNPFDFLGSGPITARDAWQDQWGVPQGDLSSPFTWTTDSYYRIYHTANEWFFTVGATIRYYLLVSKTESYTLTGKVTEVKPGYIVVRATNTVASVPNTDDWPLGQLSVTLMNIPAGRYVAVFYDHVVVGAPTFNGITDLHKVMWSNLYDYADWLPRVGNEADSYTCADYQRPDDVITGITGIQPYKMRTLTGVREALLIFTSSCIYAMNYTGLPRVVNVAPLIRDYGNGLLHATAALDDAVAWVDVHHADFYVYKGQGPESIGQGIRSYFFSDLNLDSDLAQKTYAYVDRLNFEVVWVYVSVASSGAYDKAVAYNYRNSTWSIRSVENISAFCRWQRRAAPVTALVGTNSAQTAINGAIERTADSLVFAYGTSDGKIITEAATTDLTVISQSPMVIETGDRLYESAHVVKEISGLTINATALSALSIDVYISARESVDTTVSWVKVGTWTQTLGTKFLTFQPVAGKVIRYKFSPVGAVRNFVWSGFEEIVRITDAAR